MRLRTMFGNSRLAATALVLLLFVQGLSAQSKTGVRKQVFGKLADGTSVDLYVLTNSKGVEAAITNLGGTLVSLKAPDRTGKLADIVLGYSTLAEYESRGGFFGVTVGRYANRIANGEFTLSGKKYSLARNNGKNALHGGPTGFHRRVWTAKQSPAGSDPAVELSYLSRDGEEGYPGNLQVQVTYTLRNNNDLEIAYRATTDKETVVNFSNHSFFNLAGEGNGDILAHQLTLHADRFTPVDATLIPTGELRPVAGTPFDFTKPTAIGARIDGDDPQLKIGRGYDHNWALNGGKTDRSRLAAEAYEPGSGRLLQVLTTEPGVQLFTGNSLNGSILGKSGKPYIRRGGFCLETQHFPDSPNHPNFPSTVLKPGEMFQSVTIFRLSSK